MSAGVARQYSGTAGRIENCQVGVFSGLRGSRRRPGADRPGAVPAAGMAGGGGRAGCRGATRAEASASSPLAEDLQTRRRITPTPFAERPLRAANVSSAVAKRPRASRASRPHRGNPCCRQIATQAWGQVAR
jgi:hypothetical protein